MTRLLLVCTCVLIQVSCGREGTSHAGVRSEIDTVGTTEIVRNSGEAPRMELSPVVRIGSVAGGATEFGRIRSVVADREGRVYVADNMASEVRVFAPDGSHVSTIGRKGGGPGEFGDLYSLAWLGHDLVAMDPMNGAS